MIQSPPDDSAVNVLVPNWFAILAIGLPLILSLVCLIYLPAMWSHPAYRDRQWTSRAIGWFLLGMTAGHTLLIAWWWVT